VIEVKDWAIHHIKGADSHTVTVFISGAFQRRTNPDRQAKGHVDAPKETLQKVREFLSKDPRYTGRLKIPIGRMVAFPNMSEADSRQRGLLGLIARERTLLRDDLGPRGRP
jgi:hypothetical protein